MTDRITTAQARQRGYYLTRGAYIGGSQHIAGRWYIQREDVGYADYRGAGYRTRREALDAIALWAALADYAK